MLYKVFRQGEAHVAIVGDGEVWQVSLVISAGVEGKRLIQVQNKSSTSF